MAKKKNMYQKATKGLQDFGGTIAKDYGNATKGLQKVGNKIGKGVQNATNQIGKNLSSGQSDIHDASGKVTSKYYETINPLKGAGKAFVGSFKKGGKIKKTGIAKVHKGERVLTKEQSKKWIQGATKKMEKKGTVGAFGKATPKKIAAAKKKGGVQEKRAVFAENMKKIARKQTGKKSVKKFNQSAFDRQSKKVFG